MTQGAEQPPAQAMRAVDAHGLVARPALIDRLEKGVAGPVTLLAAPAGSGKTVLVRSWLESDGAARRAAWVPVERGERDAQRFWSTVIDALRLAAPGGATIAAAAPTPDYQADAVVRRLVDDLAGLERDVVLVIDDLHEIASPEILDGLTYLLGHLPAAVHIVLITRRDPQLGLHRQQLEGGLTELRNADLQFTLDETRQMLSATGVDLADSSLQLLQERTEGWVAGLRLAAISLAAHPEPDRFVAEFSGSDRTVAEYLLAEVLGSQPPDVRRLLVRTSLLGRVNGELGDLLTGDSGTERHLRVLADAGGFVVALDASRTWFRFHHLFADLLAAELRHTEPGEVAGLHLAAATWHAERGDVLEAIVHAQAAGERELAAGLLIGHYFSLTLDGRQATAHALLEAFGSDDAVPNPELATVVASEQLAEGSLDQAAAHLALAERHAGAVPADRRHRFDLALLVTRLSLARRRGDFPSVRREVQAAGGMVEPRDNRDITINNDVQALMLMNLGIVEVWSGHLDDGTRHLTEARELAQLIKRPYLEVTCLAHQAQAVSWQSFTRSRDVALEAIALAEDHGWASDPVVGPALVTLGVALIQAGRIDEGELWLERAEGTLRPDLEPAVGFVLHMAQGAAHVARGRYAEAIERYRQAERLGLVLITGSPLAAQLRWSVLYAMLELGDMDAVRSALGQMTDAERSVGEACEVRAGLALAEGDPVAAIDVLAPTLTGSASVHHPLVVIRALLSEARARAALGDTAAAETALERALDLAEPDTLIVPFMHIESRDRLEQHPRYRTAHGAFIAEILDALSGRPGTAPSATTEPLREPLSAAELRVLRFLPTNLSAAGIAAEIYVSTNTVKTHMRHLYAKLDAHNRLEAVDRARALGLLGHSARTSGWSPRP